MTKKPPYRPDTLAYSPDAFADAVGLGRSAIWKAMECGELKTVKPTINGKPLRRRLILRAEAVRWLAENTTSEI